MTQQAPTSQSFPTPSLDNLPRWLVIALLILAVGCSPQIGDPCDDDGDCPNEAACDRSTRDGICTIEDCQPGDCPSEAVCARFDRHESYCLRSCTSNDDCRDDHRCIDDDELDISYCFVSED